MDLLVSMNDYNIAHDVQRFWPLDPTKICFFFVKNFMSTCFLFQPEANAMGGCGGGGARALWLDLIGIWASILQAKKHKEHWVHLPFFCQDMHPFASLFDVDDDFQRCFIFTLFLMSFITADAFNCEEFNHCILSPADLTSTWYLAE